MAIEVETKDCTAVTDAELADMADLCADGGSAFSVGLLSKQTEEWVLCVQVRDGAKMRAYAFCTLERIGGTPAVLVGLASVARTAKRDASLRALVSELFHRALMAFPDEDVLIGTRFDEPSGFEAFRLLVDIVPRPGHKASGEERAWGRRLAKRFGIDNGAYADREFVVTGNGATPCVFDHTSAKPETLDADVAAQFDDLDGGRGDTLIAFGWARAELLEKYS